MSLIAIIGIAAIAAGLSILTKTLWWDFRNDHVASHNAQHNLHRRVLDALVCLLIGEILILLPQFSAELS